MMIVLVIKLKSPIEMKLAWRSPQKLGLVACLPVWLVKTFLSDLYLSCEVLILDGLCSKGAGRRMDWRELWVW